MRELRLSQELHAESHGKALRNAVLCVAFTTVSRIVKHNSVLESRVYNVIFKSRKGTENVLKNNGISESLFCQLCVMHSLS